MLLQSCQRPSGWMSLLAISLTGVLTLGGGGRGIEPVSGPSPDLDGGVTATVLDGSFKERRHLDLEEIFFRPERPPSGANWRGVLPGIPRDFLRPDYMDPGDSSYDPDHPYRSFKAFEPVEGADPGLTFDCGPYPSPNGEWLFVEVSFRGPTVRAMRKGQSDPLETEEIARVAEVAQTRLTAQVWIPGTASLRSLGRQLTEFDPLDPTTHPLIVIAAGSFGCFEPEDTAELGWGPSPGEGSRIEDERAWFAREAVRRGAFYVRWIEGDECLGGEGVHAAGLPQCFGFPGQNAFALATRQMILARDPKQLTVRDLRLDYRYGLAQGFLLTKTFLQHYLMERIGEISLRTGESLSPFAMRQWLDSSRTIYAGGSKTGSAAMTAAGADVQAVGVDMSGYQGLDGGERGALRRYLTDWCEHPEARLEGRRYPNKNGEFVASVYSHRDRLPSYARTYLPSHDPDPRRYEKLLILETASTHDHNWPLGSTTEFWRARDGLDAEGRPDPGELRYRVRHVRNLNLGHGEFFEPSMVSNPAGLTSRTLTLANAVLTLIGGEEASLPDLETVAFEAPISCDPFCDDGEGCWEVRVRLDELPQDHVLAQERFRVHLLFSDDRDTRRFDGVGDCEGPGVENRVTEIKDRASIVYDTLPGEDYFIPVSEVDVIRENVSGAAGIGDGLDDRRLAFCPPVELLEFARIPLVAVCVELFLDRDGDGEVSWGDSSVFTEIEFAYEELYPVDLICEPGPFSAVRLDEVCPGTVHPGGAVHGFGAEFSPDLEVWLLGADGEEIPVVDVELISRGAVRFSVPPWLPPRVEYEVCVGNGTSIVCGPTVSVVPRSGARAGRGGRGFGSRGRSGIPTGLGNGGREGRGGS